MQVKSSAEIQSGKPEPVRQARANDDTRGPQDAVARRWRNRGRGTHASMPNNASARKHSSR